MKKKIIAVLSMVLCLALFLFACGESDAEIELVKWKAPSYDDTYYVGEEIRLKKLTVEDENGNEYEAVITVKSPDGEALIKKKASGSFTPETAGDYTVYYAILTEDGEEEIAKKTTTITVIVKNNNNNNGGNGGNNGGNNGGTSTSLSIASQFGTMKDWTDGSFFTISGNKITFKKSTNVGDYKGIKFDSINYTPADKEEQMTLTIKNSTNGTVTARINSISDAGAAYSSDLSVSAGATQSLETHVLGYSNKDSATKLNEMEIYFGNTAGNGTIEIGLTLGSSSGSNGGGNTTPTPTDPRDAHTKSVLGNMTTLYGNTDVYTASGTTVTVKQANTIGSGQYSGYLGIQWASISGYNQTVDKSISFKVTNTTGGVVTLKYKAPDPANPDNDDSAIYFDFEIPAGASEYEVKTNINGDTGKSMPSLSSITLFIGNTTGRGSIVIVPKLSNEVIKYGNDINIENPTGATITAKVDGKAVTSAQEGDVVTLSYVLSNSEAYNFGNFTLNGTAIEGNTFTMPDEDVTVSATVNKVKNVITITQTNAGTITATVEGAKVTAAAQGVEVTLNVNNIKEGYALNEFKVNGTAISGNTFTMPSTDVTVSATYTQTKFYVIVNQASHGTISATVGGNAVSATSPLDNGAVITLSNNPNANYIFVKYVVNGADYNDGTVTINGRDLTITAVFEQNIFTITKTNPTGATISAPATAEKGTTVTLDYSLSDNYTFDGWTVKDASGNTITVTDNKFTMPSSNVTVTLKAKILSATASVTNVSKYDEITYTNNTSSVTVTGTSQSNDLYHSAEIKLSNMDGQNKITFTVTNNGTSSATVYVWVATETNNRHSNGISIQSVTGATKGNGSGHDIAQQTISAGESVEITITLSSAMTSISALRVTPYMGGTLTLSDFIIGG
ncbi:MAG: hypothetical protein IJR66_04735 [Clostridia bacterium]|nr:hypothetical protein [Clostridia bacterium]